MKKIISYILSFISAILLIISIFLGTISSTILNENFLFKAIEENDYYSLIDTNIKSQIEGYIQQSGFSEEVFENLYTKEQLKNDIDYTIIGMYGNGKTEVKADEIENNLKKNIDKFITENGIVLNDKQQQKIDTYVKKIVDIYILEVSHPVYFEAANKAIITANRIIPIVSKIVYISFAISIILILAINIKDLKVAFIHIAISLLTSAVFIGLEILILSFNVNVDNILILNSSFTLLVISIIKKIISQLIKTAVAICTISIAVIIIFNIKNSKKVLQNTHN